MPQELPLDSFLHHCEFLASIAVGFEARELSNEGAGSGWLRLELIYDVCWYKCNLSVDC